MKKLFISIFIGLMGICATAQNAGLFTYDREMVNSIMDSINENNSSGSSYMMESRDTAHSGGLTGAGFFLLGFGSGCLGTTAGVLLIRTGIFDIVIVPIIIGVLAAITVADLIVVKKTHSWPKVIWTTVGGVVAPVVEFGIVVLIMSRMTFF